MIRFYYHPTPNPAKVALFLEETGLPYEVVPVDTSKGQQHAPEFRAINRYRREAERHYSVLDKHLEDRNFIVGSSYTVADISAWGWIDRAGVVLAGSDDPLAAYPNIKRWFRSISDRPAVAKARAVGSSHTFKREVDEESRRALFPSNYPPAAA